MNRNEKIQILKNLSTGKMQADNFLLTAKELKGEVMVIRTFYDHLKFTGTIGITEEDLQKVFIAPSEYKDALEDIILNQQ